VKPRDASSPPAQARRLADGGKGLWRRWGGWAIGLVLVAALVALVWHLLSDTASTKRVVADAPMLMLPPPPPPPPEPEKPPEPEPEKVKPESSRRSPSRSSRWSPRRTTRRPAPRRTWATR
jgi:protein TonB